MSTPSSWLAEISDEEIIRLSAIEYILPNAWLELRHKFPSLLNLLKAKRSTLIETGLTEKSAALVLERTKSVSAEMKQLTAKGIRILRLGDENYPALLTEITDPPLWLFYQGDLAGLEQKTITIVGTRKPSTYALNAMAYTFDEKLLQNVTVLSGLAYGVDKRAHQQSLKACGKTVAVLAGGLNSIYPADHQQLAKSILDNGGALISEYPPLSRPQPYRFPVRNRILAGLSPLTIIVEAAIKSGTLTTAKAALDYNRDVMAIPGEINRISSEGGNFLIKHGAGLLNSPTDLHEYYEITSKNNPTLVDKHLQGTLDLVATSPQSVDKLVQTSGKGIEIILSDLTQLELLGLVDQTSPGQYIKTKIK